MVNTTLDAELKGSVHALAIKAQTPAETAGR
jgi:BolA family transcriptional regulator, general stress-responsive regulator